MIELARAFGKTPEEIADAETGMSQYWWEFALIYLGEQSRSRRGAKSGKGSTPAPEPEQDEVDEKGRWFLTG